jgi:hypothetical protein
MSPAYTAVTDQMHALLVTKANALEGCTEGFPNEAGLATLVDVIEACEAVRWPHGKNSTRSCIAGSPPERGYSSPQIVG